MDEVTGSERPSADGQVVAALGRWPEDEVVVERAVDEARSRGSRITLLHVEDGGEDQPPGHIGGHVRERSEVLAAASTTVRRLDPGVPCRTAVVAGPVAPAVIGASRVASLVVLGSEGASPLVKLVRGAITSDVVARSRCPVEVVPRATDDDQPLGPPTRVVAIVRGTVELEDLVPAALEEASRCDVPLAILWSAGEATPAEREDLRAGLRSDIAPWRRMFPTVPTDIVVVPGHLPLAVSGLLGPRDLVVLLRRQAATFWGRPDRETRDLLDHACRVLVIPASEHDRSRA